MHGIYSFCNVKCVNDRIRKSFPVPLLWLSLGTCLLCFNESHLGTLTEVLAKSNTAFLASEDSTFPS